MCVCVCVCMIYYKELVHEIMETGNPKFAVWAKQARDSSEPMVQMKTESHLLQFSIV